MNTTADIRKLHEEEWGATHALLALDNYAAFFGCDALQSWRLNTFNAMAQGSKGMQKMVLTFEHNGTAVVTATVLIGASPYDLRPFVVEETVNRYLDQVGEISYDTICIQYEGQEEERFDADYFDGMCSLNRLSRENRRFCDTPVDLISLYKKYRDDVYEVFPKFSHDLLSAEARSHARQAFKPLHAAYLYMTYAAIAHDQQMRSFRKHMKGTGPDFRVALKDFGFIPRF